jgi:HAE1 family hydrophobic/amphiphilic exporter-1
VSVLVDGAKASDYLYEGKEIDLKVVGDETSLRHTHLLEQMPIATPTGELVSLGTVAEVREVGGPVEIRHARRQRVITVRLTPPETMPLGEAMNMVNREILEPMQASGKLSGVYQGTMSGTADKLEEAARSIQLNLLLAVIITYLLMSALFESFLYPFVIMFSVPLAAMGGFLGLAAVNRFLSYQALDVLTMLGFIILIGTVVNNPILIVHQSLNYIRKEGLSSHPAIMKAVENRVRPIFMSVSTSVFAMLPLILSPGAGSELYRGLGSVVVGGLIVSTVFTIFLVPALFSLALDAKQGLASLARKAASIGRGNKNGRAANSVE